MPLSAHQASPPRNVCRSRPRGPASVSVTNGARGEESPSLQSMSSCGLSAGVNSADRGTHTDFSQFWRPEVHNQGATSGGVGRADGWRTDGRRTRVPFRKFCPHTRITLQRPRPRALSPKGWDPNRRTWGRLKTQSSGAFPSPPPPASASPIPTTEWLRTHTE